MICLINLRFCGDIKSILKAVELECGLFENSHRTSKRTNSMHYLNHNISETSDHFKTKFMETDITMILVYPT